MEYLLKKLKAGTDNYKDVKIPGTDFTVRIRLLSSQDILDASNEADKIFKNADVAVNLQNINVYEGEKDTQHLYRACRDIDGNPLAENIMEFRGLLTVPVKEFLISEYLKLNEERNPSLDNMSDAEFDALIESVKKNPTSISNVSNINTLKKVILFLASRAQS